MGKVLAKMTTRLQKFLAAIAGDCDAPTPVTNQEKLLWNIAEEMKSASQGGGSGGVLVVTDTNGTLDKTWKDIHDAMLNGIVMLNIVNADDNEETLRTYIFSSTWIGEDKGGNLVCNASSIGFAGANAVERYYSTNSASGYPTLSV